MLTIGGVNEPQGVAIGQKGELVVAEGGLDCVSIFNDRGETLRSCGKNGAGYMDSSIFLVG